MNPGRTNVDPSTHRVADDATELLQLAARLHAARGNPQALIEAIAACRKWFACAAAHEHPGEPRSIDARQIEALAGRVTHCAQYGFGACGSAGDPLKRARCAALAPHLHEAAKTARLALRAALFENSPATWILDRHARVLDANTAARSLTAGNAPLTIEDGCLCPQAPGGAKRLQQALADVRNDAQFSWPDDQGQETVLWLHRFPDGSGFAASLRPEHDGAAQIAPRLAARLGLTLRQSELAAHLLLGHRLTDAAQAMGISRSTANEHLAALHKRIGVTERMELIARLRAAHR